MSGMVASKCLGWRGKVPLVFQQKAANSDREDTGAQNLNYTLKFPPPKWGGIQPQILYFVGKNVF